MDWAGSKEIGVMFFVFCSTRDLLLLAREDPLDAALTRLTTNGHLGPSWPVEHFTR